MARLVMTTEPLRGADSATLRDVFDEDDLAWAEANGSTVFLVDEETGNPGRVLYDGEAWLVPRPEYVAQPEVSIPSIDYVDQRTEVMQSELEAVVDVISSVVPARATAALKNSLSNARVAMRDGDSMAMATIAQDLSDTRAATIFTVQRAEEVSNVGKPEWNGQ